MRQITLNTFEKSKVSLFIVAAWYADQVVITLEENSNSMVGVFHTVESNGLTRTFPHTDYNRKALDFVLSPEASQVERERKKLKNHL